MRVNDIDARTFKAKQLTVEVQPPSTAVKYDWNDGDLKPNAYKTEEKAGTLKLVMYFVGKDRTEVHRCISDFLSNLNDAALLDLEGYKGSYYGMKTSAKIVSTLELRKKKLELEFDGFFIDVPIKKELKAESQEYMTQGSRDAPCVLRMINTTDTDQETTVEGLTETGNIVVTVPAGKTLIIDGDVGVITVDGENAFSCVMELWEFPKVTHGKITVKRSNTANVRIIMEYRPMWLV